MQACYNTIRCLYEWENAMIDRMREKTQDFQTSKSGCTHRSPHGGVRLKSISSTAWGCVGVVCRLMGDMAGLANSASAVVLRSIVWSVMADGSCSAEGSSLSNEGKGSFSIDGSTVWASSLRDAGGSSWGVAWRHGGRMVGLVGSDAIGRVSVVQGVLSTGAGTDGCSGLTSTAAGTADVSASVGLTSSAGCPGVGSPVSVVMAGPTPVSAVCGLPSSTHLMCGNENHTCVYNCTCMQPPATPPRTCISPR